jgi:hypothetical protein
MYPNANILCARLFKELKEVVVHASAGEIPLRLHVRAAERSVQRPLRQTCHSRPSMVMNYRKFWI